MSNQLKDLTADQVRRIYRDFLKGVPKEKILKKNDIGQAILDEIVGIYSKKKHPNDVGGATLTGDIKGPLDLLVTPLDTGSTATEHPVVAHNPKDLAVTHERVLKEFDYNSPEEELRKKGGEVTGIIAKRNHDERTAEADAAREAVKENKEATKAILEELTDESERLDKEMQEAAADKIAKIPDPEEIRRLTRELGEKQVIADQAGELAADLARQKHFLDNQERDAKLIADGKEETQRLNEETAKARQEEAESLVADADKLRKEVEDAKQELAERSGEAGVGTSNGPDEGVREGSDKGPGPDKRDGGTGSTGGDRQPPSEPGTQPEVSTGGDPSKSVEPAKADIAGLTKNETK